MSVYARAAHSTYPLWRPPVQLERLGTELVPVLHIHHAGRRCTKKRAAAWQGWRRLPKPACLQLCSGGRRRRDERGGQLQETAHGGAVWHDGQHGSACRVAGVPELTAQAFSAMLHECIGQNKLSASRVPRITEKATECLGVRLAWWRHGADRRRSPRRSPRRCWTRMCAHRRGTSLCRSTCLTPWPGMCRSSGAGATARRRRRRRPPCARCRAPRSRWARTACGSCLPSSTKKCAK